MDPDFSAVAESKPRIEVEEAKKLLEEEYDLSVVDISCLPSYDDQNMLVNCENQCFVLKIANPCFLEDVLDMEIQAMQRLTENGICTPAIVPTKRGQLVSKLYRETTKIFLCRLVTFLPGILLYKVESHSDTLLRDLGRTLAKLDKCLLDFDHLAAHRDFDWDLKNASRTIRCHLEYIPIEKRSLIMHFLEHFEEHIVSQFSDLRWSVIHGDANDYNVLIDPELDVVCGIFDFGDMVYTPTVCDVAIACAYYMLGKNDLIYTIEQVLIGYTSEFSLTAQEIALVFPLACIRLCVSVVMSAYQSTKDPNNEYLLVTAVPGWMALSQAKELPFDQITNCLLISLQVI